VSEARKRKNRRLKQAKEEAQQEIEKYRMERELAFKVNTRPGERWTSTGWRRSWH
jgi:hypothetical protein